MKLLTIEVVNVVVIGLLIISLTTTIYNFQLAQKQIINTHNELVRSEKLVAEFRENTTKSFNKILDALNLPEQPKTK